MSIPLQDAAPATRGAPPRLDAALVAAVGRAAEIVSAAQEREATEAAILKRLQAGESTLSVYGWK